MELYVENSPWLDKRLLITVWIFVVMKYRDEIHWQDWESCAHPSLSANLFVKNIQGRMQDGENELWFKHRSSYCKNKNYKDISMKYWTVIIGLFLSLSVYAQLPSNRIKPGTMYHAGDTVRLPRMGLSTRIPEGWSGVLPRDTEVFLLMPENNSVGEIYVVINEKADLQVQRKLWESRMDLAEGLRLQRDGEIFTRGTDVVGTMAKLVGNSANNQAKIYLEAKCSPNGFCVSYVATSDAVSFENVKKALQQFVDNTTFTKPSNASPY